MISCASLYLCLNFYQIYYDQADYKEQKYDQMNYKCQKNLPNVRFTYHNSQNYYPSPVKMRPYRAVESHRLRAGSLPPQKVNFQSKSQNTNYTKIIQDVSSKQRQRRHKIFQESHLVKHDSMSKSRRKSQTIFGEYKRNSVEKSPQKETQSIKIQTQNDCELIKDKKVTDFQEKPDGKLNIVQKFDNTQLERYIDDKLAQKLTSIYLNKGEENQNPSLRHQQVKEKQQQILYLRLQVQRLKRCQSLNKQNQHIYKKLVHKLNEQQKGLKSQRSSKNTSTLKIASKPNSDKKDRELQTPINSLCDLKKIEGQKQLIQERNEAQQTILSPQELFVQNGKIQNNLLINKKNYSKEITFSNTQQFGPTKKHSRRAKIELIPTMLQVKQQILYNQATKPAFSQKQIGNRLQEINIQLQRKLSRRSSSRPNKEQNGMLNKHIGLTSSNYRTTPIFLY